MQIYKHDRYNELVEEIFEKVKELGQLKGGEYAGDDDRLANFRRNAEAQGLPMTSIWGVYAAKHWDAIMQFVKDKNTGKERKRMEPIDGRALDLIVYLILFIAMTEEMSDDWISFDGRSHIPPVDGDTVVSVLYLAGTKPSPDGLAVNFDWQHVEKYKVIQHA